MPAQNDMPPLEATGSAPRVENVAFLIVDSPNISGGLNVILRHAMGLVERGVRVAWFLPPKSTRPISSGIPSSASREPRR
jgi:hypothetical protein